MAIFLQGHTQQQAAPEIRAKIHLSMPSDCRAEKFGVKGATDDFLRSRTRFHTPHGREGDMASWEENAIAVYENRNHAPNPRDPRQQFYSMPFDSERQLRRLDLRVGMTFATVADDFYQCDADDTSFRTPASPGLVKSA